MALAFRNVNASPSDDVRTWPYEGLAAALDRGLVADWRPILREIEVRPWGEVARRVEHAATNAEPGVTALFARATARARADAERRERDEVADRVRLSIRRSGLPAAAFARLVGTSASRLSTYSTGAVVPSASMLVRIERAAELAR